METTAIEAALQHPEEPRQVVSDGSAERLAYPACVTACALKDLLKHSGGECVYHRLNVAAPLGKSHVQKVLRSFPVEVFAEVVTQGADAPCITSPQVRAFVDHQIHVREHNVRSKEEHRARKQLFEMESARRAQKPKIVPPHEDHTIELEKIVPRERTIGDRAMGYVSATILWFDRLVRRFS